MNTLPVETVPLVRVGWSLLHPALEIRDTARCGLGIFAKSDIATGEILCVMGGQVADTALQNSAPPASVNYSMDFSEEFSFCPLDDSQVPLMPQFYFNHSCRPNCGFQDSLTFVAIRPISEGEECRYDYAFCMWNDPRSSQHFEIPCQCGEPECRKIIREDDWTLVHLQTAYGQWFMPFLQRHFKTADENILDSSGRLPAAH